MSEPKWEDTEEVVAAAPTWDETAPVEASRAPAIEEQPKESDISHGATGSAVGAGVGVGLGKLAQGAVKLTNDHIIPSLGALDKSQIDFISSNPTAYKNADSLSNLMEQFKNLAQDVSTTKQGAANHVVQGVKNVAEDLNQAAYDKAASAKDFLGTPEAKGLSKEQYVRTLGGALSNSTGALDTITPEARAAALSNHIKSKGAGQLAKLQAEADDLASGLTRITPEMDLNTHFAIKNQLEIKQRQIEALKNSLPKEAQAAFRQSQGIPEEMLRTNPELADKSLSPVYRKQVEEAVKLGTDKPGNIISPEALGAKFGLIPQLREGVNYDKVGAGPTKDMDKKFAETLRAKVGELNPQYDKDMKASSRAINTLESMGYKFNEDGQPILSDSKATQISNTMANPDVKPEAFEKLQSELAGSEEFSKRQPLNLTDVNSVTADVPETRLQQASRLEDMMKQLGVKVGKDSTAEVLTPAQNKIVKAAGNIASPEAQKLSSFVDEADLLSSNPKFDKVTGEAIRNTGDDFLKQVNAANIQDVVKNSGSVSDAIKHRLGGVAGKMAGGALAGTAIGGQNGAILGGIGGAALDIYGTKAQELAALAKSSKLAQFGSDALKLAPGILGGLGAGIGAMSAANAGEISPEEAGALTAVETVNPIPGTDAVSGYVEGKKAFNQGADPASIAAAGLGGFISPVTGAVKQAYDAVPEATRQILNAPDKIPAALSAAEQYVNTLGTEKSIDARSRMEQNLNAYKSAKDSSASPVIAGQQALKQATPDQLMELSQSFKGIKGAEAFAAPLESAAQADSEHERQARLFGLYQQPAFRQMLKKKGE